MAGPAVSIHCSSPDSMAVAKSSITTSAWLDSCSGPPDHTQSYALSSCDYDALNTQRCHVVKMAVEDTYRECTQQHPTRFCWWEHHQLWHVSLVLLHLGICWLKEKAAVSHSVLECPASQTAPVPTMVTSPMRLQQVLASPRFRYKCHTQMVSNYLQLLPKDSYALLMSGTAGP